MKPTTEDFLITFADALWRTCQSDDPNTDQIKEAAQLRIMIAIAAKEGHDKECQRLADEWVQQNKAAYLQSAKEYGRYNSSVRDFEYRDGLSRIWLSMRDKADPIFRDYISEQRPTA